MHLRLARSERPIGDQPAIFRERSEPGDGLALAVKDLFDTAGVVTTYGSAIFADHVPSETAAAVRLPFP
jgi:Asp-tRNA(Asn)/Glu-tRNA(Gln) amidotransferase A subunit family amidase